MGTMIATEINVSIDPATDQNSLRFGLLPERKIRIVVIITIIIGTRGSALSTVIVSLSSPPSLRFRYSCIF